MFDDLSFNDLDNAADKFAEESAAALEITEWYTGELIVVLANESANDEDYPF